MAGLLLLVSACAPSTSSSGTWLRGPARPQFFQGLRAVAMRDGRVLVASFGLPVDARSQAKLVQIYDPPARRWSTASNYPAGWIPGPAVLLGDGSVLFTPGQDGEDALRYVAGSDRWVVAGRMPVLTRSDTATLLRDGRVLAIGGSSAGVANPLEATQIFDPATGSWSRAAPIHDPRSGAAAVLLQDGQVLVIGGIDVSQNLVTTAERYDPALNRWSPGGHEQIPSSAPTAIRLPDGGVLVVNIVDFFGGGLPYNQIYDPGSNTWQFGDPQPSPGGGPMAALRDGRIVMVKIASIRQRAIFRAEIYDPRAMKWSATPVREGQPGPLVSLGDGRLMAIGPQTDWIFDPSAAPPPAQGDQGLGSAQVTVVLAAIAGLLVLLVLGQYAAARGAERRRLRPV